jgi:hypothetical protein
MEEPQPTPEKPQGKLIPDPNTDFGNEAFDAAAMSQSRFSLTGINDWIFSLMRPKKKPTGQGAKGLLNRPARNSEPREKYMGPPFGKPPVFEEVGAVVFNPHNNLDVPVVIPPGHAVENGLIVREKTLAQRVAMQLRNPFLNRSSTTLIRGCALAAFVVGALMIYAEIPTHPEIVGGILLCIVAGNVLIANRG